MKPVYVWWLSQSDCELVEEEMLSRLPDYIQSEFRSRLGRGGRGRLWVDAQFGDVSCSDIDHKPACRRIDAISTGGIVIHQKDAELLPDVGFVTDLEYNYIKDG